MKIKFVRFLHYNYFELVHIGSLLNCDIQQKNSGPQSFFVIWISNIM
jgi:hypothetical protein